MRDILPGAQLVEVRVGLNRGDTPLAPSQYFCTLVFEQLNDSQLEIVKDSYSISKESLPGFLPCTANIGKRIKQCSKTLMEQDFLVRYDFDDGTCLKT
jgi:hypothetical protein